MRNSKFKIGDKGYVVDFYEMPHKYNILAIANIKLIEVTITKVGRDYVEGTNILRYGHVMEHYQHLESRITTKKKRKAGKEIPFSQDDFVAFTSHYKELLTYDEAKLKMIQYISNDFNYEVCIGCTCHQDESF